MDQSMSVDIAAKLAGVTPQAILNRIERGMLVGKKLLGRFQIDCEDFFNRLTGGTGLITYTQANSYINYILGPNAAEELGLPADLAALLPEGADPYRPCIQWHDVENLGSEWETKAFEWSEIMRKDHGGRWWYGRRRPVYGRYIGKGKIWA